MFIELGLSHDRLKLMVEREGAWYPTPEIELVVPDKLKQEHKNNPKQCLLWERWNPCCQWRTWIKFLPSYANQWLPVEPRVGGEKDDTKRTRSHKGEHGAWNDKIISFCNIISPALFIMSHSSEARRSNFTYWQPGMLIVREDSIHPHAVRMDSWTYGVTREGDRMG